MTNSATIKQVSEQIKKEICIDEQGRGFISFRGAARLADVSEQALSKAFQGDNQKPSKLSQFLTSNGFEGDNQINWGRIGIPDSALALILEYYGYEAQERYRREQAKAVCRVFRAIGIRSWMQQVVGHDPLPPASKQAINASDAIKLLNDLRHSLGILGEQLEAGHALLNAGNGMVRALHNAIHNQGGSLNQAETFLKKARVQIGQMEETLLAMTETTFVYEVCETPALAMVTATRNFGPVSAYSPKGSARSKGRYYFRFSYREGGKLKHKHIPGGDTSSPIAIQRRDAIVAALEEGKEMDAIVAMIEAWKQKRSLKSLVSTSPRSGTANSQERPRENN